MVSVRISPLVEALEPLGPDLLRTAYPNLPATSAVRIRPLRRRGWHRIALLEDAADARRRILLKVLPTDQSTGADAEGRERMLATEYRTLTEVAPRICERDLAVGCPRAFSYLAAPGVLTLEVVDGPMLSTVLFGLWPRREVRDVCILLERCGAWVAALHRLTRIAEEGNPFEWLFQEFQAPAMERVFRRHGDLRILADVRDVAARLLEAHRGLRVRKCTVHGVFAPYHVLVAGDNLRVIDLESAHVSYPYRDLVFFDAYAAFRPPWARALAAARLPPSEQRRAFKEGYERHAGPFSAAEDAVLGLGRVHALVRFAFDWERNGRGAAAVRALRYAWWRRCLRRLWAAEAPPLRRAAAGAPLPPRR